MGVLDRVIKVFSPKRAWLRMQYRQALSRYEAGTVKRKKKAGNGTGESEVVRDAATCRAVARDLERNHDILRGALHTLARNVVGSKGIRIDPQPRRTDDSIDDDVARQLTNLWRDWSKRPEVTQTMGWARLCNMTCRTWLRDGEVFTQIVEGKGSGYRFPSNLPLALEMMEADMCPLDYRSDDPVIEAGIARNQWGQPIAYYFHRKHPSMGASSAQPPKRIPAERVLHLAIRDRLSGLRGVSHFASGITRLEDIKDYESNERLAARISSHITGYVKRDKDMDWTPPESFDPSADREFELKAAAIFDQTMPGESLELLNPTRPNVALDPFVKSQMRRFSSGCTMSYSAVAHDFDGTYSAQRQELVESTEGYRVLTEEFCDAWVRPIWEHFVDMCVATGALKVSAGIRMETLTQADFRGPKMPWINPVHEVAAAKDSIRAGLSSLQESCAERGVSVLDVIEQTARVNKLAAEMGVVLDSNPANDIKRASAEDNSDGSDDDETETESNMRTKPLVASIRAAIASDRPQIASVVALRPVSEGAYELLIYGDIGESWWGESVTAQSVVQQLMELDAQASINVRINSYGGSVSDGLAIYNALKRHAGSKNVSIDGVAMSIASLIAMAGDSIEMPATSLMMIHAPWGGIAGNAKEMRQYADVLDTYADAMADAYVTQSGKDKADVLALLQDGVDHYYTGEQALAEGFATKLISSTAQEPDEQSKAAAKQLLNRYAASFSGAPEGIAEMAVAAMQRAPLPASAATKPPPKAAAKPPAAPATTEDDDMRIQGNAAGTTTTTTAPAAPAPASDSTDRAAILAADNTRRTAIRGLFARHVGRGGPQAEELAKLQRECEDNIDCTPEAASMKLVEALGKDVEPAAGTRVEITRDERATYREGAVVAMLHRARPQENELTEQARDFRGMNLLDLARDCVERAGVRTRGLSRSEIAVRAFQSTSDFPLILADSLSKSLRAGYEGSARTFLPWTRRSTLPDFKEISRNQISGAPSLLRINEGEEYEHGAIGEGAERYRVFKYGRKIALTWETVINDDLDALSRIPFAFGASAADLESDLVYAILINNANMADGVALFHADHGNLGTAAALIDAIHPDPAAVANPLAEMRRMMILQKGLEGRYITIRPKYLLVPPDLEEDALKVTNAAIVAARGNDANVIGPSLTPISEPRLHDGSATAWYGVAEPGMVDTIEYAYLEGHEGVFTETRNGFDVDGMEVKCRQVFGAKAIDHRGLFKNAGDTPTAL